MSVASGSGADVDMRVCSKRGIVEVESAPSWVSALMERMDQRLDANGRRIELRMDERLDTNERRIEQVLGLHQTRLDKHDVELRGGVVPNRVDSSVNSPLKPHPLLVRRIPWVREDGVREQCWSVVGPLLGLLRHRRLIVLSTRKWQMNCSLV